MFLQKALAIIDKEAENAHNKFKKLQSFKEPLIENLAALQDPLKQTTETEADSGDFTIYSEASISHFL